MHARVFIVMVGLLLLALADRTASAEPHDLTKTTAGYTYFNRPGADMLTHDGELTDCLVKAAEARAGNDANAAVGIGPLGLLIAAPITGGRERRQSNTNVENCMVAKRWRVVRLSPQEGAEVALLDQAGQAGRLTQWVGAEPVHGEIVRTFLNEGAADSTPKYGLSSRAAAVDKVSLSLTARNPTTKVDSAPDGSAGRHEFGRYPARDTAALAADKVPDLTGDSALVVVDVKGAAPENGEWLSFRRLGSGRDISASATDHKPDELLVWQPTRPFGRIDHTDTMRAFVVPPGRWVVNALGGDAAVTFCLGAPYFDVRAGEVVFAGSIDLGAEDIGPDMNLGPAQAFLSVKPALAGALRPANWTNGAVMSCAIPQTYVFATYTYALELKGVARPGN